MVKRILLEDAISDFGRHLATGRGGVDRQVKNVRLLMSVLGPKPVRFADELSREGASGVSLLRRPTELWPCRAHS